MIKHKETILLTGATGLLGKAIVETAPAEFGLNGSRIDITDDSQVRQAFSQIQPAFLVHAASYGSVDYCEHHKEEAFRVNVTGTKNLVMECERRGIPMMFISSNAIFDGLQPPYHEESSADPINYYGETKVRGERLIAESNLDYTILRLTLMYGWNDPNKRSNAVTWLLDKLRQKEKTRLVDDTYVNPTYNIQAAEVIWKLISHRKQGVFHFAGNGRVNRYEFGIATARIFGYDPELISAVSSDYFPELAPRMPDTTFSTKKIEKIIGIIPLSPKEGLLKMKKEKDGYK